jgi:two-component system sensor histidine kinase YesM
MNTINTLVAQAVYKQALTKEAELRSLHNQIDAHFLFNTLENIKMLAEIENQRTISDSLTSLGGMMRYNFKWSGEYAKLRDEIRHIENYTKVMNIRFDEPILLKLDIPEEALELEMLKMSLQPIVENAVKHAWIGEESDKQILIQVLDWQNHDVQIIVTDNGIGMHAEDLSVLNQELQSIGMNDKLFRSSGPEANRNGIGLRNVQERIRLYYGNEYGLRVFSEQGQFTTVVMSLPKVLLTGRVGMNDKFDNRR